MVLESTSYPGTTVELLRPIREEGSGLLVEIDFRLATAPSASPQETRDGHSKQPPILPRESGRRRSRSESHLVVQVGRPAWGLVPGCGWPSCVSVDARKNDDAIWLDARLGASEGVPPPVQAPESTHTHMPTTVLVDADRDGVMVDLANAGIESRIYFPPVHALPVFAKMGEPKGAAGHRACGCVHGVGSISFSSRAEGTRRDRQLIHHSGDPPIPLSPRRPEPIGDHRLAMCRQVRPGSRCVRLACRLAFHVGPLHSGPRRSEPPSACHDCLPLTACSSAARLRNSAR